MLSSCSDNEITNYSHEQFTGESGGISYKYSIYRDNDGLNNKTVIYYFHGSEGDENTWHKTHAEVINELRKNGKPYPIVVAVSFGKRWLLTPECSGKTKTGYLEIFVKNIIPVIEKQIGSSITSRYVMGFSMGGLNAAQLIFRFPDLFEKGIILSPYIYPVSPFSRNEIIDEFVENENIRNSGIKRWIKKKIFGWDTLKISVYGHIANLKRDYFTDSEAWDRYDIMKNIKIPPHGRNIKIYISCGTKDEYGFYPGAENLAKKAISLNYAVTWRSLSGGHVIYNNKDIADFLLN